MTNILKQAQYGQPYANGTLTGGRNRIINGDMRIDQRNAGAAVPAYLAGTQTYTVDRFSVYGTLASKFTVQQNQGSVTPPAGFSNYLGITSSAATTAGATDIYGCFHKIEGYNVADLAWGTPAAKAVTFSFQVYSSVTGTFSGYVTNSVGSRGYVFTYTVSTANSWTPVTVLIPGDTAGTWLTNNGIGILVGWNLGSGSSYLGAAGAWGATLFYGATGSVSVISAANTTFYITGVQFEAGTVATPFERIDYGDMLRKCQRYTTTVDCFFADTVSSSANRYAGYSHPEMRAAPVLVSNTVVETESNVSSAALGTNTAYGGRLNITPTTTGTVFAHRKLILSSEL